MSNHGIDVDASNFKEVVLDGSRTAPVVIDFWAPWCAPCRALKPILEKLAEEYGGRFTLAKINSDENPDLAARFGVRGIPAVKAVVDGTLVDEFVGALPESQVRAFIERVLPTPSETLRIEAGALRLQGHPLEALATLKHALELDPRNEVAAIDQLELLVELGRIDEAREVLDALGPLAADDPRVTTLKARIAFAAAPEGEPELLRQRIARDGDDLQARLALARHHVHAKAYEQALDQLLEIIRRDRKFENDIGRRTMLEVFNLLGPEHDIVSKYRRLLASALY